LKVVWDEEEPPEDWKKSVGFPFTKRREIDRERKTIEELAC
jgi:hypothetical protein